MVIKYGVRGVGLDWFRSYLLHGDLQSVTVRASWRTPRLEFIVGSTLFYLLYSAMTAIARKHGQLTHKFTLCLIQMIQLSAILAHKDINGTLPNGDKTDYCVECSTSRCFHVMYTTSTSMAMILFQLVPL